MKVHEIFLRLLLQLIIGTVIQISAIKYRTIAFDPSFFVPLIFFSLLVFVPTEFALRVRNVGYLSFVAIPVLAFVVSSLLVRAAPSMQGITGLTLTWAALWLMSWPVSLLFSKVRQAT